MAPMRGRGSFRARGRGRGGPRGGARGGRGRGGGRGQSRGGRDPGAAAGQKRTFAPTQLEEAGLDANSDVSDTPVSDLESDLGSESASDEEEAQPASNAYQALLRSYQTIDAAKSDPPRKRRKTDHIPVPRPQEEDDQVEVESENDDTDDESIDFDQRQGQHVPDTVDPALETEEAVEGPEIERDSFVRHFADPDENELAVQLKAISNNQWITEKLKVGGGAKCLLQAPWEEHTAAQRRKITSTKNVNLKPRLVANAQTLLGDFSELEQAIAPSVFAYQDVLLGARTVQNAGRLRHLTCLHALNHIFKTRDRVIKNNAKLSAQSEDQDAEYRDQGFTRPKILFLLETKQACVRTVDAITQLCDFEQQENKKRFLDGFSAPEDKFSDDRPEDFRELFEGNDENEFRIGLKFTRKTMKLYSKFYNSDIIFASTLGLRRAIESGDPKKKDSDFLSSIEIVIMDQADATLMQNWEHAEYVFSHLNLQPKETHGCDFSRVRSWYLDGHSSHLRQTIVLSAYLTPQINALYNKHMKNVSGRIKYTPDYSHGVIETLTHKHNIKQTFTRFTSPTHPQDPDARFKYFHAAIMPQLSRLPKPAEGGLGILIFIPSYLDFVRLRNSLVDSNFSYASISEYTDATDVRKARSHFMSGRHSLLLYTGRAHHFHRYNLRGVKRVVFYGVPENPKYYEEAVAFVGKSVERAEAERRECWIRCAFSKWEAQALERVVGSARVGRMVGVGEKGDTFDFV